MTTNRATSGRGLMPSGLATAGLLLVAMWGNPAWADVGPPIRIRLPHETTQPAVSGVDYTLVVELTVGADGRIDDLQFEGQRWTIQSVDLQVPSAVQAGQVLSVQVRARPADADQPLWMRLTFDGRTVTKAFELSAERFAAAARGGRLVQIGGTPRGGGADLPEGGGQDPPEGGEQLHIIGCIEYQRVDGPFLGVDSIRFQLWDDDAPASDELMFEGYTNAQGCFDVTFDWDDCDIIGCDAPDIYLKVIADSDVVHVEAANGMNQIYNWSTEHDYWDDYEDSFLDFGTSTPENPGDAPAMHIFTSIVRSWRYILEVDGTSVTEVEVQWPEAGSGAFYQSVGGEIHISPDRQWNEITHGHEYGHHFLQNYSMNTTPMYCNGVCDSPPPCGHCLWCPENVTDAWNEGWPNWLGSRVARGYLDTYGITPWSAANDGRFNMEALGTCPGQAVNATTTEGYAAALLFDMDDANNEDEDGDMTLDCDRDVMSARDANIFEVVQLDQPTTIQQFIDAYWARFPLEQQDLWSTVRNISTTYTLAALPAPIVLASPGQGCDTVEAGQTVTLSVIANGAALLYQWRRNGVNLANGPNVSGVNTHTLTITSIQPVSSGTYDCVVTTCDMAASSVSQPFRVHVFPAPGAGHPATAMGRNDVGQLGQGTTCTLGPCLNDSVGEVLGLSNVVQVAGGDWHALALKSDGTVWAWGSNSYGQIGQGTWGTPAFFATPQQVPGLTDIVAVAAGYEHSMALKSDGTVWLWGADYHLQLGNAHPPPYLAQAYATAVMNPDVSCAIGIAASRSSSSVVLADGTVWSWGWSLGVGVLGDGAPNTQTRDPVQVLNVTNAVAIAAGDQHVLSLRSDGSVWAWGNDGQGQCGGGNSTAWRTPGPVLSLTNVARVRAGAFHSLAMQVDGTAWAWGSNQSGQLGIGMSPPYTVAVPTQPVAVAPVSDLDGSHSSSMFVKPNGTLWGCGSNGYGQLGLANVNIQYPTPQQVTSIATSSVAVGSGTDFHIVLRAPAVDLQGFAAFPGCMTGPGGTAGGDCDESDWDGDADVDLFDFAALQNAFDA